MRQGRNALCDPDAPRVRGQAHPWGSWRDWESNGLHPRAPAHNSSRKPSEWKQRGWLGLADVSKGAVGVSQDSCRHPVGGEFLGTESGRRAPWGSEQASGGMNYAKSIGRGAQYDRGRSSGLTGVPAFTQFPAGHSVGKERPHYPAPRVARKGDN